MSGLKGLLVIAAACAIALPPASLAAQDTGRGQVPVVGRGRGVGRQTLPPLRPGLAARPGRANAGPLAAARQGQALDPQERQAAIRQIRQAMARRIRNQLALSPDQFRTLQTTEQKYDRQRNELQRQERDTRVALRGAMLDSVRDQTKIAGYLDQLTQAQRKRADLVDAEQKELSSFLTPMQRAQYLGLKENMAKLIERVNQSAAPSVPPGAKPDSVKPPER